MKTEITKQNIQTKNLPSSGIFFNDQIFDAYIFSCELIQKAQKSIILIDNYIDCYDSQNSKFKIRNSRLNAAIRRAPQAISRMP